MTNQRLSPLTWLGIALVVAIALMAIFGAVALSPWGGSYGGGYGMMGNGSWSWALLMMGIPAVILIVILVVVLVGIREPSSTPAQASAMTPLETLNARYARSELSREEYLRIRNDLTGVHGGENDRE